MSASPVTFAVPPVAPAAPLRCRVAERQPCGLQASCQPVAARSDGDVHWPGVIRDISTRGVGLVLGRRFERGTGLAIELPETASRPGDTLLARVVHATALPGRQWLLGCTFVSELSVDEVQSLRSPEVPPQTAPAGDPVAAPANRPPQDIIVPDVIFACAERAGGAAPRARRLHLRGRWPLPAGVALRVWGPGESEAAAKIRVKVQSCEYRDGHWVVAYTFADAPAPDALRFLDLDDSVTAASRRSPRPAAGP